MAIILIWQSRKTLDTISNSFYVCRAMLFSTQCQTASMPGSLAIANWYVECYKIAFAILMCWLKSLSDAIFFSPAWSRWLYRTAAASPSSLGSVSISLSSFSNPLSFKSTLPMSPDSKKLCSQQHCFKCMIIICWRWSSCSVSHQCCVSTVDHSAAVGWSMINDQFITLAIDNVWMVQLIFFLGGVNSCTDDLSRNVSLLHQS